MSETVEILRLGHEGHGVTADQVFVPYSVPGDVVRVARNGSRGRIEEIVSPGPWRGPAACAHFTRCGGCAVQHVSQHHYLSWKRGLVSTALSHRGFGDVQVDDIRVVPPGTRRRAIFKAMGTGRDAVLGFYEPESHRIVDITECPLLVPSLAGLLPPLRRALGDLLGSGQTAELHATATDTGVDLSLKWKRQRAPDLLMDLAELSRALDLARLTWNGEPISIARQPALRIGRFTISLPPEPFLQPSKEGERLLQDLVYEAVAGARRVADLFAGCGTFALTLAPERAVHAVDQSGTMINALAEAARAGRADLGTEERDLLRRPLTAGELARFDAIVLDPPRAGAKAQVEQLAVSNVPRIVYVSCNPASFARDARILVNGAYRITRVVPVDQFLWSPHVELVATFERTID